MQKLQAFKSLLATGPFAENLPDLWKTVADVIRSEEKAGLASCPPRVRRRGIFTQYLWSQNHVPGLASLRSPPAALIGVPGRLAEVEEEEGEGGLYQSHLVLRHTGNQKLSW